MSFDNKDASIISKNARLRIHKVLSHMEENRKLSCSSSILTTSNCNGAEMLDIEDMVAARDKSTLTNSDLMEQDEFLLDPAQYIETQKPLLEASTLPRHCYLSN